MKKRALTRIWPCWHSEPPKLQAVNFYCFISHELYSYCYSSPSWLRQSDNMAVLFVSLLTPYRHQDFQRSKFSNGFCDFLYVLGFTHCCYMWSYCLPLKCPSFVTRIELLFPKIPMRSLALILVSEHRKKFALRSELCSDKQMMLHWGKHFEKRIGKKIWVPIRQHFKTPNSCQLKL